MSWRYSFWARTDRHPDPAGADVTFRKKLYVSIDALQADLDDWLHHYNHERTHQGKMCCGRTPLQTMIEGKEIWKEKFVS